MNLHKLSRHFLVFALTLFPLLSIASLPDGLSVIGLDRHDSWRVYISDGGQFQPVQGIESPRGGAYHHSKGLYAYIGADGLLRENDLAEQSSQEIPLTNAGSRYTQPHYSADGRWLYMVELPEGKSRRTRIVGYNRDAEELHAFVRKRTAQFEPTTDAGSFLYYTTAICVDDCEGMIWELWRRDLRSGRQVQLTLMNAVANHPHMGSDGWLYFSSNADAGRFHIWRMQPEVGAKPQQLSTGNVRDSDPILGVDGVLYFIRKSSQGTSLMRWQNAQAISIDTPDLKDLRNLESGR